MAELTHVSNAYLSSTSGTCISHGDPHVCELPAFRDSRRTDARLRDVYVTLKRQPANDFRDNRNAYTNAKTEFVERVLRVSGQLVQARQRLPEE